MQLKNILKFTALCFLFVVVTAFQPAPTLTGTWQYVGGIYNGKKEGPPAKYMLQRKYNALHHDAFVLEKGYPPTKYETGNYTLKGDTCTDTQTWCSQPSKITNIPIHYFYTLKNDTVTFKATLPTGMKVEEYWRRVRK
jgi:hypothetical protein